MSIKSIVIAAALGTSTLLGIGAASAAPIYRGETPREARIDSKIARKEIRERRFERRTGRVDGRREREIHRLERRDARLHNRWR